VHIRVIRCLNGQKDFRCGSWEARYLLGAPPGHEGTPNLLVASKVKRATRTVKSPEFEPDPGWGRDGSLGNLTTGLSQTRGSGRDGPLES